MALFYVTGAPGSGKTTLRGELSARGYDARDLDHPDLGGPRNVHTGERTTVPPAADRTPEWFEQHVFQVRPEAFERLRVEASDRDVVVLGVASTDDEIRHLFDRILYLRLDDDTLRHRAATRSGSDYGRNAFELADIVRRKHDLDAAYAALGVTEIDASGSIGEVADEISSHLRSAHPR